FTVPVTLPRALPLDRHYRITHVAPGHDRTTGVPALEPARAENRRCPRTLRQDMALRHDRAFRDRDGPLYGVLQPQRKLGGTVAKQTWPGGHLPPLTHAAGGGGPHVLAGSTQKQVEPPPIENAWHTLPSRHVPPQIG